MLLLSCIGGRKGGSGCWLIVGGKFGLKGEERGGDVCVDVRLTGGVWVLGAKGVRRIWGGRLCLFGS